MGLRLNVDLDTNLGFTKNAYIRIETCRINKVQAQIEYTTSCWINKKSADKFYRKYLDESMPNAEGIITKEVVFYENTNDTTGKEVSIKNFYKASVAEPVKELVPVYEEKEVEKVIPYVTFDKLGEEIIKEKIVKSIEKVQTKEESKERQKINFKLFDNPFEHAYKDLKNQLSKIFPKDKIEIE